MWIFAKTTVVSRTKPTLNRDKFSQARMRLSALVSKYLSSVVAVDQQELDAFFGNFVPRSRVKDAVKALLAARELSFIRVGNRSLIQITPAKVEAVPRVSGPREKAGPRRTSTPRA